MQEWDAELRASTPQKCWARVATHLNPSTWETEPVTGTQGQPVLHYLNNELLHQWESLSQTKNDGENHSTPFFFFLLFSKTHKLKLRVLSLPDRKGRAQDGAQTHTNTRVTCVSLLLFFFFFLMRTCMCVHMYAHMYVWGAGGCELPDTSVGTKTRVLWRAVSG